MFLAIAVIPLLFVSALTFYNYKNSLETNRLSQLRDLTVFRADSIETYFAGLKAHIEIAQGFYNIKINLPVLNRFADVPNNPEAAATKKMLGEQLQQMQSVSDLSDIMLVDPKGRVVYANKPGHYSKDMSNGNEAEQKAFSEGKDRVYFSDVYFDKEEDNRFEILLTAPASDFNGAFIGVIAFEADMTPVYNLIQDTTGLGQTGEVLVGKKIGNQVEYLSPLRHEPNAVMKRINIGGKIGSPIQEAVQGKTGAGQLIDYRGKKVIAAWRYIPSLDWGMVAKIDAKEGFADVTNLRHLMIIILAIIFALSGVMAFSIAQSISEPIKILSKGAQIVGSGNLDYQVATNLKDEIGQLSRTFDKMTRDLKVITISRDELNREITERKQAEESLRESEIKYRTVADNTYDWEFWLDTEGKFIYSSPSCERITGHKPEEFLADAGLRTSLIHPDDRPQFEKHLHEIEHKQQKEASEGEWRYVRPDGTICWVAHICQPVYDDSGRFLGIRGSNRDITNHKQAEEALRQSEQYLSTVFHASPTGIFITRLSDGLFLDVNEAFLQIIGYSKDEVVGHTSPELNIWVNPEDRERIVNILCEQGRTENREIKLRHKSGQIVDLLSSILPLERSGEHCVLGTITNITARKQMEEELRKAHDELEKRVEERTAQLAQQAALLDLANDAIIVRDLDNRITYWNQGATETYGWTKEQALGEIAPVLLKTEFPKLLDEIEEDLLKKDQWEGELIHTRNDGTQITVASRWVLQRDNNGNPLGTLEINRDITERKQIEKIIKAERKRFEDVLEMMPAYAVLLTPDYHVAYANRTFRDWFGDDNGKKCYEFLFNRKEPCENCETYNVMKTGKSQFWEWTGPNGHNYDIYDYPFTNTDGSPLIMEIGVDVTAHKQAQTALRSTSLYARSLIEASLDPLVTISPKGKITDVNKATELVTGLSRENLIGSDFSNYFTEPKKAKEGYQKVLSEGQVKDYPLSIRHKSGHITDVLYNATVYKNEAGEVQGVFAAARDVTVQKQASQYARSLIESSLDPLVTISADGKITDVNEATIKVTGVSREKLIGTDFSNYFTEPQKAQEGYRQVFAKGFVTDYPLTIRHKDGHLTDVLYNASVYKDTSGKVIGVFAAARDVTIQKQASQYARSLIESSLDPLVTISADGKITDVNEATVKVTGISREHLIGSYFLDYFTEPDKAREGYQKVISEGFVKDYPLTIRHTSGRLTDVLYNATVYKNEAGQMQGVFAAARDITERKAVEKRQNVTNSLLELFARETSRKKYLDEAVKVVRDWSGCEFVGIRVKDKKENIPYESCVGFDQNFLALENSLHLRRDNCVCIRAILQNPQQQEQKFMTAGGSFYCNDSKAFLQGLTESQKKEYRANCIKWGFQSIAVIPVQYHEQVMGAIHLTDFQKDMVSLPKVQFVESIVSPLIGEAIHRFNTEAAFRDSKSRLAEAQRIASLGNWDWDITEKTIWWSDEVHRIFGIEPGKFEATYEAFLKVVHPDDRKFVETAVNEALENRKPYNIDHRIIRPDKTERIVHEGGEVKYDENGRPIRMVGTVQDITELKQAEEKIRYGRQKLKMLAAKLELVEEQERRRIASDLHDSIGQILAFSTRELKFLQKSLPENLSAPLTEIAEQLDKAIHQARTLSFDLSPSLLYDIGFEVAVEDLAEKFSQERKIPCSFENCHSPKPLAVPVKVLLYRSIRELLINAAKHSGASNIKVSLRRAGDEIHITVEDDGKGFEVSQLGEGMEKPKGFGIFSIRERLDHIGGQFKIESAKGKGTKAILIAPLSSEA
jgi:PAS domain S-box-containing protein